MTVGSMTKAQRVAWANSKTKEHSRLVNECIQVVIRCFANQSAILADIEAFVGRSDREYMFHLLHSTNPETPFKEPLFVGFDTWEDLGFPVPPEEQARAMDSLSDLGLPPSIYSESGPQYLSVWEIMGFFYIPENFLTRISLAKWVKKLLESELLLTPRTIEIFFSRPWPARSAGGWIALPFAPKNRTSARNFVHSFRRIETALLGKGFRSEREYKEISGYLVVCLALKWAQQAKAGKLDSIPRPSLDQEGSIPGLILDAILSKDNELKTLPFFKNVDMFDRVALFPSALGSTLTVFDDNFRGDTDLCGLCSCISPIMQIALNPVSRESRIGWTEPKGRAECFSFLSPILSEMPPELLNIIVLYLENGLRMQVAPSDWKQVLPGVFPELEELDDQPPYNRTPPQQGSLSRIPIDSLRDHLNVIGDRSLLEGSVVVYIPPRLTARILNEALESEGIELVCYDLGQGWTEGWYLVHYTSHEDLALKNPFSTAKRQLERYGLALRQLESCQVLAIAIIFDYLRKGTRTLEQEILEAHKGGLGIDHSEPDALTLIIAPKRPEYHGFFTRYLGEGQKKEKRPPPKA